MERTHYCSKCKADITYTEKDVFKKIIYEEQLPFSRIFKRYQDLYVKCPNCGNTFADYKIFMWDTIYHGPAHHTPIHEEYEYDIK